MNAKEKILWLLLNDEDNNKFKFKRQFQHGNYVLDFYSKVLNIAIEIDDDQLKSDQTLSEISYHNLRENYLNTKGIQLLKISESFLQNELSALLNKILNQKEKK
jgi:very-short-patch-repair endonuclease